MGVDARLRDVGLAPLPLRDDLRDGRRAVQRQHQTLPRAGHAQHAVQRGVEPLDGVVLRRRSSCRRVHVLIHVHEHVIKNVLGRRALAARARAGAEPALREERAEVRDAVQLCCFGWARGAVCCRKAARARRQGNECNCTPHGFSPVSRCRSKIARLRARQPRKRHSVPAKARAYPRHTALRRRQMQRS